MLEFEKNLKKTSWFSIKILTKSSINFCLDSFCYLQIIFAAALRTMSIDQLSFPENSVRKYQMYVSIRFHCQFINYTINCMALLRNLIQKKLFYQINK